MKGGLFGSVYNNSLARIPALDSLRGVASLVVLFNHLMLLSSEYYPLLNRGAATHSFVEWLVVRTPVRLLIDGQAAVLLFFVLSGFVLSLPWGSGQSPSFRDYVLKRVVRLYVPYVAAFTLAAAGFLLASRHPSSMNEMFYLEGWGNVITWWTVTDGALLLNQQNYILLPSWSLAWEMRISLILPPLVMAIQRWRLPAAGSMVLIVLPMLSLMFRHLHLSRTVSSELSGLFFYATFFVCGSTLAVFRSHVKHWLSGQTDIKRCLLLGVGLVAVFSHWPVLHQYLTGAGTVLIVAVALSPGKIESFLNHRFLHWLGRISYSLYLVHLPLLFLSVAVVRDTIPRWMLILLLGPASIVLAQLFHNFVEAPAIDFSRRIARNPPTPAEAIRDVVDA